MRTFVWVDAWQQQCCGDEFRIGSSVTWDVIHAQDGDDWVTTVLGPDWEQHVPYLEDHHGVGEARRHELRGVVRSIRVVTCDRRLEHEAGPGPRGSVWVPVPGSGRLRHVEVADPWEPETPPDDPRRSFDGWVVEVDAERLP